MYTTLGRSSEKGSRDSNCICITSIYSMQRATGRSELLLSRSAKLSSDGSLTLLTPRRMCAPTYVSFKSLGGKVQLRGTKNYRHLLIKQLQKTCRASSFPHGLKYPSHYNIVFPRSLSIFPIVLTIYTLFKTSIPSSQPDPLQFYHPQRPFMAAKIIQRSYCSLKQPLSCL